MTKYCTVCRCGKKLEIEYEAPEEKTLICESCGITIRFEAGSLGITVTFG